MKLPPVPPAAETGPVQLFGVNLEKVRREVHVGLLPDLPVAMMTGTRPVSNLLVTEVGSAMALGKI